MYLYIHRLTRVDVIFLLKLLGVPPLPPPDLTLQGEMIGMGDSSCLKSNTPPVS
jgi:hypothetical protein